MKKINQLLCVAVVMLFTAVGFSQGVTTSSINGKVTEVTGGALPGASVVAA